MDISLEKKAWMRYRRPLFTPQSRVRHVLLWTRTLYLTSCGLLNRNTTAMITLGIARTDFYVTQIGFIWRRKSYSPRMPQRGVKQRLIFLLGWTNPLRASEVSWQALTSQVTCTKTYSAKYHLIQLQNLWKYRYFCHYFKLVLCSIFISSGLKKPYIWLLRCVAPIYIHVFMLFRV